MSESKMQESKYDDDHVSNFELDERVTISDNTDEVYAVRFSPDGKHLVAGCGDGSTRIFRTSDGRLVHKVEGGTR
jgi:WD40 repeat protein